METDGDRITGELRGGIKGTPYSITVSRVSWDGVQVAEVWVRVTGGGNGIRVDFGQSTGRIYKYEPTYTQLTSTAITSTQDVWYDVCVKCVGQNVTVWRKQKGSNDAMTQVMTTSLATVTTSDRMDIVMTAPGAWRVDDIAVLTDDGEPVRITTYAYDDANELLTMSTANSN